LRLFLLAADPERRRTRVRIRRRRVAQLAITSIAITFQLHPNALPGPGRASLKGGDLLSRGPRDKDSFAFVVYFDLFFMSLVIFTHSF
jgi:hypothetical protein